MPLDVFASLRTTAIVGLVTASFSSPILVKSDVVSHVGARLGGVVASKDSGEPKETVVAGGVEFSMPASWARLGATSAGSGRGGSSGGVGTVVSALCPGGSTGAACSGGAQLTFVAYSGAEGHELPMLTTFEKQLDKRLGRSFPGFVKVESKMRPGADGIRYLDYEFTHGDGAKQRLAAFRHDEGSGVIVMVTGDRTAKQDAAISAFVSSGHVPLEPAA